MRLPRHLVLLFCVFCVSLLVPTLIGTIGTQPAQAQCVTIFGRRVCGSDVDPTRLIPGSREAVEEAWGIAGRAGYSAAARWMEANNGRSQALDATQKQYLRPWFEGLVDRVAVVYNANLMDEWSAGGYRINVGNSHQTYCNRIYIDDPYQTGDLQQVFEQLVVLAHELVHSRQCESIGGESNFGYHYFREFKRAGQSYRNNIMEQEAYELEASYRTWLDAQRPTIIRACNNSGHWAMGAGVAFWSNETDGWSTYGSAFLPDGECSDITLPRPYRGAVYMLGFIHSEPQVSWGANGRLQNWFCVFTGIADPNKYYIPNAATTDCSRYGDARRVQGGNVWEVSPGINTFTFGR